MVVEVEVFEEMVLEVEEMVLEVEEVVVEVEEVVEATYQCRGGMRSHRGVWPPRPRPR